MYRIKLRVFVSSLLATMAALAATAQLPELYPTFPEPAPGSFGVQGAFLGDGRLLAWNGDTVYLESGVGTRAIDPVAAGYIGDPGFVTVAPDGATVLLGAGFSGNLYLFDSAHPAEYQPSALAGVVNHFAGAFLSDTLVILDAGLPDFSGSELAVFDLSGGKTVRRAVVTKSAKYAWPKGRIVNKPPLSWSAGLFVDAENDAVYAMDGNTRELRSFSRSALIAAYGNGLALDWEADGSLIGAPGRFFTGGVSGVTADGLLVIGGSEGYLLPGGIQLVDPVSGLVTDVLDPADNQGYYNAFYNSITREIAAVVDGTAYALDVSPAMFRYRNVPGPAESAFLVLGTALLSGHLLLWNGDEMYIQPHPRADLFYSIASGYLGDPGFIAKTPNGLEVVLGAGYSGKLYDFNLFNVQDYSESALLGTVSHYAADFISPEILVIDTGKPDFSGSELLAVELGASKAESSELSAVRLVDKPGFSYSANVFADHLHGVFYAMDGNTRELRRFSMTALLDAYAAASPLDWNADGTLVGQPGVYYTGGVSGITPSGLLVIGGSEGYLLPGGIQLVDPDSGEVVQVLDPEGNQGFYSIIYNDRTNVVTSFVNNEVWAVDLNKLEEPEGEGEGSLEGSPEGEGSADGEGALEGEPEGEGALEGEPDGEGSTEGDGALEGEPDGEGNAEGEGEGDPEGEEEPPKSFWCCSAASPSSPCAGGDTIAVVLMAVGLLLGPGVRRIRT